MNWRQLLLLGAPLVLALLGCQQKVSLKTVKIDPPPPLEVSVVPVVKAPIESSVEMTGTLFPWKFATIASEVTGVIENIPDSDEKVDYEIAGKAYSKVLPLDIGHEVKQGDVLVKINSSESELAVQLAQAKVNATEKELANLYAWKRPEEVAQLEAQCEEGDAVLIDARADLQRSQTLLGRNATSKKEVDDAKRAVATAEASKKKAQAAFDLAQAGPTQEQIAVAQAQLKMAQAELALEEGYARQVHDPLPARICLDCRALRRCRRPRHGQSQYLTDANRRLQRPAGSGECSRAVPGADQAA